MAQVTEYTYKIALGNDKFDIVHMEKLKLAKHGPPASQEDPVRDVAIRQEPSRNGAANETVDRPLICNDPAPTSNRPVRNIIPVRRLTYDQDFAQSEQ